MSDEPVLTPVDTVRSALVQARSALTAAYNDTAEELLRTERRANILRTVAQVEKALRLLSV